MTNSPDHLLSEQDLLNAALVDAGELKPCPLCRGKALSGGERNPTTGNVVYRVFCNASRGLVPTCGLSLSVCLGKEDTAEAARAEAVRRWNQRPDDELRDALKAYANPENWTLDEDNLPVVWDGFEADPECADSGPALARKALGIE